MRIGVVRRSWPPARSAACGCGRRRRRTALQVVPRRLGRPASSAAKRLVDASGAALAGDAAQARLTQLEGDLASRRAELTVAGKVDGQGLERQRGTVDRRLAGQPTASTWTLPDDGAAGQARTTTGCRCSRPETIHPDLPAGDALARRAPRPAERAGILDGAGQPIVTQPAGGDRRRRAAAGHRPGRSCSAA